MRPVLIGSNALTVLTAAARSALSLRRSIVGDRRTWGTKNAESLEQMERESDAIEKAIRLADEALGKKVPA